MDHEQKSLVLVYAKQMKKILEIEKDPRKYIEFKGYHKVDDGYYLKNPQKFLDTFGWQAEDVGLSPTAIRKLLTAGVIKRGYTSRRDKWYRLAIPIEKIEEVLKGSEENQKREIKIPKDLFECIVGYEEEKWLIRRALEAEKPCHVLLSGPPSSGKSLFLLEISRIPGAHYYAAGGTITKAGLMEKLMEDRPQILILDEIEKADREDLSILLSLMEHGIVTKLIHGQEVRLKLNTRVFAACNYEYKLPRELRSRFLILRFKEYSKEEFIEVSKSVLVRREGVDPELATYIAETTAKYTKDVRDSIKIARLAKNRREVDRIVDLVFSKEIRI